MSIVAALDKVLFFNASSKYSVLRMKTEDSSVVPFVTLAADFVQAAQRGGVELKTAAVLRFTPVNTSAS